MYRTMILDIPRYSWWTGVSILSPRNKNTLTRSLGTLTPVHLAYHMVNILVKCANSFHFCYIWVEIFCP